MSLTQKLSEHTLISQQIQTADATGGVDAGWVLASNYRKFAVMTCASVLTGTGVTDIVLQGNTAAAGAGTDVVLSTTAYTGATAPDAVGDSVFVEVDLDDLVPATQPLYVNAHITCNNALDDTVVTYILSEARFKAAGLTAGVLAP